MFLQYIVVFLSRDVLNQFQLRGCNMYPPPQFLYGFSLFQRIFFLRLGGRSPPLAPPWLRHCSQGKTYFRNVRSLFVNVYLLQAFDYQSITFDGYISIIVNEGRHSCMHLES
jgi:hypothetical protein